MRWVQANVLKWIALACAHLTSIKTHVLCLRLSASNSPLPLSTIRPDLLCRCCTVLTGWKYPPYAGDRFPMSHACSVMKEVNKDAKAEDNERRVSLPSVHLGFNKNQEAWKKGGNWAAEEITHPWHCTCPAGCRFEVGHTPVLKDPFSESGSQWLCRCGGSTITISSTVLMEIPDILLFIASLKSVHFHCCCCLHEVDFCPVL